MAAASNDSANGADIRQQLDEAIAHRRATAEVLEMIRDAPHATQAVFQAIVERAADLCGAAFCNIQLFDGEQLDMVATHNFDEAALERVRSEYPMPPDRRRTSGRSILERQVAHIPDISLDSEYPPHLVRTSIWRSLLSVPMLKGYEPVGTISVAQPTTGPFSDSQIQLLQTFANQAIIAMENAKVVEELARRRDELAELNATLEQRVAAQVAEIEQMAKLRRFLPEELAEIVINSGDDAFLRSHRREVSVVFCDLRGFTAFSEVAEPEEVTAVLADYHKTAGPLIAEFGGTLERFLGDGLMVVFNDPLPCDQPVHQALRLSCALRDAMSERCESWRDQGYELGFGAGISYGYATLGQIGFEGRYDYTAIGTVVNQAARLCDEAKAGEIFTTQRIANIARAEIETEPLGDLNLKGLRLPVQAFKVVRMTE